jgi:signal transduction histidine kinase
MSASRIFPTTPDLFLTPQPAPRWRPWRRIALGCGCSVATILLALWLQHLAGGYAGAALAAGVALSAWLGGLPAGSASAVLSGSAYGGWLWAHAARLRGPELAFLATLFIIAALIGYLSDRTFRAEAHAGALTGDLANLRREISAERTDLIHFHDFSLRLLRCLETKALLNEILEAVIALQAAPFGVLVLFPPESASRLEITARFGLDPEQMAVLRPLVSPALFPVRRREIIEDLNAPGNVSALQSVPRISAMFSSPVVTAGGKPLGAMVTFFDKPHRPRERDIRLTDLYLCQAANAIENARLYSRSLEMAEAEQHRATLLRSVNDASLRIHSAVSLDSVLQVVTDKARQVVGAHRAFTSFAPYGNWTRSITCFSVSPDFAARNAGSESANAADATLFTYVTGAATELLQGAAAAKGERAAGESRVLVAPLTTGDGHTVGAIRLADKIEGSFTDDDRSILIQLAHVASVAIENVRLLRKAQEQIGERERAQEALERSKQSLQIAQRAAGIGVWEWDLQLGGLTWSDEISALHAVPPGRFDGRYESWLQTIEPLDREAVHRAVARAISTGAEFEVQYRLLAGEGGPRWMEARGQVIASSGTPIRMSGIAMDITARKLSEEALRTSEKLAATGRLAATIAHEVNNPLAAVTNLLYLLRVYPQLDETAREYVSTAEAELSRVTHITRQTLGFYRESSMAVETDPVQLVEEVVGIYGRQIEERGIAIRRQYEFEGSIRAFPGELRQVLANLICNAVEATPEEGTIRVHIFRDDTAKHGPGVRLVIADNGPGIPPDIRSRIFEPFFTTKGERGTGLGLWVTRGIIEKHGGSIRFRSSTHPESHGTCFAILLPFEFLPKPATSSSDGSRDATAA